MVIMKRGGCRPTHFKQVSLGWGLNMSSQGVAPVTFHEGIGFMRPAHINTKCIRRTGDL
ncbi:MAG: hypothetical protein HWN65_22755 [Candidatus Helarchaeota archaeon]|nr:hypothetical protein [Candidatus Helarchaeota archaeon]